MAKAEIAMITNKGGITNLEGVDKLVHLMQLVSSDSRSDLAGRVVLANVIAATDRNDCLGRFVQLKGFPMLDGWLQAAHKWKIGDGMSPKENDKDAEELLFALLCALDKLPVTLNTLQTCQIGKTLNHLRNHKSSEIQKKSRSLVETWKKVVDAEIKNNEVKSVESSLVVQLPGKQGFSEAPDNCATFADVTLKNSTTQLSTFRDLPGIPGHADATAKSAPVTAGSLKLPPPASARTENWAESMMADNSQRSDSSSDDDTDDKNQMFEQENVALLAASDSSDRSKEKVGDHKMLRRLAQNREAARKRRLRKKVYVQQLESSRLKLSQLEQELQRARQQGIVISNLGDKSHSLGGNGALAFDVEYARWLEEHNRQVNELRAGVNAHANDSDLCGIVDGVMAHYDELFRLKSVAAKADVFHMLSGMWETPAERCFLWLGGFRSSELLKLLANQLEPLSEQQLVGICNLQQSAQQAEDALSQGMEALQLSLAETLTGSLGPTDSSGNVANYKGQMAMAMGKLGTLENFLRQADNLRQQTLQQMHRILTIRQSAHAFLVISDYFSRLRALSSLWLARPKE